MTLPIGTAGYVAYDAVQHRVASIGTTVNDQTSRIATRTKSGSRRKGESRFQWMAGAFYEDVYDWWHYGAQTPELHVDACLGAGAVRGVLRGTTWATTCSARCPTRRSTTRTRYDRTIKQTAVFGSSRTI